MPRRDECYGQIPVRVCQTSHGCLGCQGQFVLFLTHHCLYEKSYQSLVSLPLQHHCRLEVDVALKDYVVFHLNDTILPVQLAPRGRKVGIIKLKHIQPAISFGQGTCPRPPTDASLLLQPQSHAETTERTVCNLVRRPFGCRRHPVYECRHQPERVSF